MKTQQHVPWLREAFTKALAHTDNDTDSTAYVHHVPDRWRAWDSLDPEQHDEILWLRPSHVLVEIARWSPSTQQWTTPWSGVLLPHHDDLWMPMPAMPRDG